MLFYKNTNWEDLDYLIVDMPPGTGDIHITLGQEVKFDGAVIVTTPHDLSYIDVIKGIEMFDDLKIPTLSILENMSKYTCSCCGSTERIFGTSKIEQIKKQFGIVNSFEIPIYKTVSELSDKGLPPSIVLSEDHPFCSTFK